MIFHKSEYIRSNFCENIYLHQVIDLLKVDLDDRYNVIWTNDEDIELLHFDATRINIVIFISDEVGIIPIWANKVDFIFRTYGNNELCDYKKIFPIPCGFMGPFEIDQKENTYFGEKEKTPLKDRKYELFYSGQKSRNRKFFIFIANLVKNSFNSMIRETTGFRTGLSIPEYFSIMNNTKIALVPKGAVIPESFRYMEAFESHCIVITTYPRHKQKYKLWYYEKSPAIFLRYWWQLNKGLIKKLLSEDNLKSYFENNRKYYNDYLSTKAVARYILKTIHTHSGN